jgi:hypothetical protein
MNGKRCNTAANRPVGHQIGRGESADLTTVAPPARERPTVERGGGVEGGDLGVQDLAVVVAGRAHPLDLLLGRRNDLVVAGQREAPVVGSTIPWGEQYLGGVAVLPAGRLVATLLALPMLLTDQQVTQLAGRAMARLHPGL